jgi:hypothetical protein
MQIIHIYCSVENFETRKGLGTIINFHRNDRVNSALRSHVTRRRYVK